MIELWRLLTDSDMFDMPALRLQPFLGDVSCRRLLQSPLSKTSCLLVAVSVKGAFSVCGAFTSQLGRDDFATQEAAVPLPQISKSWGVQMHCANW
jgi:hypothetical protein